ncbi:hypothetical protein B0H13DRAFT_2311778 [Mycena leptocephala]|nr:hypothetical protein B0H13DRAFT_2311778 [Mycena leptocephala]
MKIDSVPPSPRISPFRPRQRRVDAPPIPRWNPRAVKFLAIRSRQPPVTSHAACARYRLGRKAADRHRTLTRRFDHAQNHLIALHTRILHLLHSCTFVQPATLASVIHDVDRASSLCRSLSAGVLLHDAPVLISSSSTWLHGSFKLAMPPCVPSSTPADFFGG